MYSIKVLGTKAWEKEVQVEDHEGPGHVWLRECRRNLHAGRKSGRIGKGDCRMITIKNDALGRIEADTEGAMP